MENQSLIGWIIHQMCQRIGSNCTGRVLGPILAILLETLWRALSLFRCNSRDKAVKERALWKCAWCWVLFHSGGEMTASSGSVRNGQGFCQFWWGTSWTNPLHRGVKCIDGPRHTLFIDNFPAQGKQPTWSLCSPSLLLWQSWNNAAQNQKKKKEKRKITTDSWTWGLNWNVLANNAEKWYQNRKKKHSVQYDFSNGKNK